MQQCSNLNSILIQTLPLYLSVCLSVVFLLRIFLRQSIMGENLRWCFNDISCTCLQITLNMIESECKTQKCKQHVYVPHVAVYMGGGHLRGERTHLFYFAADHHYHHLSLVRRKQQLEL